MWEAIGWVILTLVFISLWSKIKEDNEYPNWELENEKENSSEKSENDEKEIYIKITDDGYYDEDVTVKKDKLMYYHSERGRKWNRWYKNDEYKIEWFDIYVRTTLFYSNIFNHDDEKYYIIKDWIFLESEIKSHFEDNLAKHPKDVDKGQWEDEEYYKQRVKKLKKFSKWEKLDYLKIDLPEYVDIKYSIMSLHLSEKELEKYLTYEIERLKMWKIKIEEICKKYNCKCIPLKEKNYRNWKLIDWEETWFDFLFIWKKDDFSDNIYDKMRKETDNVLSSITCYQYNRILNFLEKKQQELIEWDE